jgi:hypothetical protein
LFAGGKFFKIEVIEVLKDSLVEVRVVGVGLPVRRCVKLIIKVPIRQLSWGQLVLRACQLQLR